MSTVVTLEQAEKLTAQSPPSEPLKLVAFISEKLSGLLKMTLPADGDSIRRKCETMADALLVELDASAESIEGEFDAAEDMRQIREERANRYGIL